ncbi:hypothetical protein [Cryobacterium zongtaii]|uniref:hypothetical protein n=1 Tax=Cryobacterium zongtaii TaxID=1259217 RepID=UPI0013FE0AED|nr:hypothetical protein [Cryobacterium zongtaii]
MRTKNPYEVTLAALGILAVIGGITLMPSALGIGLLLIGGIFVAGWLVLAGNRRNAR